MSEQQYRSKIADLTKQRAEQDKIVSQGRAASNKYRSDAAKELAKITPRTSDSMARSYRRNAESYERRGESEDGKITAASNKLAQIARDLASAEANLEREVRQAASREEQRQKQLTRDRERADRRRQDAERSHARELGRLATPTIRHTSMLRTLPSARREELRILYLTANPEMNLRTEVEVRDVRAAIRKATHRESVTVDFRSSATPEDLLEGLNETRPHVVHFSGHAGDAALLFDNASVEQPEGRDVPYDLLARALRATARPPILLVLNGCETLDGADVLLEAVGVVIGTAASISDLAAAVFAARFYAAIAEAQPIAAALEQGTVAVDMAGLAEGWKPDVIQRPEIDITTRVLIQRGTQDLRP